MTSGKEKTVSIDVQLPKVQTHSSHSLWDHRNMHTNNIFSAVVLFARPTFRPQKFGLRGYATNMTANARCPKSEI